LRKNLLQKYQLVHGRLPENPELAFRFEKRDRPRSKLIVIKEGTPEETKRKAFESYFTFTGSTELMRTPGSAGWGRRIPWDSGWWRWWVRKSEEPFDKAQDRLQAWSECSWKSRRENREL